MEPTVEQIARQFGATTEQVCAQFLKNAKQLEEMAEKAKRTGKKVGGFTEEKLRAMAAKMRAKSGM